MEHNHEILDLRKYVGRDYETYNCLDLVREFYSDIFDLEIKHYYEGDTPNRDSVASLIETNKGDFEKVDTPLFGDIVLISLYGLECHIGVYIYGNKFLHSARKIGSNIDRVEKYANMITGYYRHREVLK